MGAECYLRSSIKASAQEGSLAKCRGRPFAWRGTSSGGVEVGWGLGVEGLPIGSISGAWEWMRGSFGVGRSVVLGCVWGWRGRVARMKRSSHALALRSSLSASALIRFMASSESVTEKVLLVVAIGVPIRLVLNGRSLPPLLSAVWRHCRGRVGACQGWSCFRQSNFWGVLGV